MLPHPPRDERRFETCSGKANFIVNELQWVPVPPGRLILQTLRSHDQYNTTIYGLDDRYRGVKGGRRVLFINPQDISALGYADGDRGAPDLRMGRARRNDPGASDRELPPNALPDTARKRRRLLSGNQPVDPP